MDAKGITGNLRGDSVLLGGVLIVNQVRVRAGTSKRERERTGVSSTDSERERDRATERVCVHACVVTL